MEFLVRLYSFIELFCFSIMSYVGKQKKDRKRNEKKIRKNKTKNKSQWDLCGNCIHVNWLFRYLRGVLRCYDLRESMI